MKQTLRWTVFGPICFNGPEDVLTETQNTQPALLPLNPSSAMRWREKGSAALIRGSFFGEYSAPLTPRGSWTFADGNQNRRKTRELMAHAEKSCRELLGAVGE